MEELLKHSFRPEFLNRLDEIVFYKPLTKNDVVRILDLLVKDLNRRLEDKQLRCVVSDAAKATIVDNAYDPVYGARPLRRFVQRHVETLIGKTILAQDLLPGSTLAVDVQGEELTVSVLPPEKRE